VIEPARQHPVAVALVSAAFSCRHPISNVLKSNCPKRVIDFGDDDNM
jgi:hypothetical protein